MKRNKRPIEPRMVGQTARQARAKRRRFADPAAKPTFAAGQHSSAASPSAENAAVHQETLHLLSIPGMRKSICEAMAEPLCKCAKELRW